MNDILITGAVGLVSTIVSGWVSWIFARKKYNTEVDSNYIENLQKALSTYDSIIAHNKTEIEQLMKKNDLLEKEIVGKTKIGSRKQKILVQGDINLLEPKE